MVEYTQPKYNFAGGYRDAGDDDDEDEDESSPSPPRNTTPSSKKSSTPGSRKSGGSNRNSNSPSQRGTPIKSDRGSSPRYSPSPDVNNNARTSPTASEVNRSLQDDNLIGDQPADDPADQLTGVASSSAAAPAPTTSTSKKGKGKGKGKAPAAPVAAPPPPPPRPRRPRRTRSQMARDRTPPRYDAAARSTRGMVNQGYNTRLVGNGRFGYADLEAVEKQARQRNAVMRKIKADMRKMEKRRKGGA